MSHIARPLATALAFLCVALASAPAFAWVETTIRAYSASVDVGTDGSATVAHELILSVRGGPLKRLEVQGVDGDATPLGDATVTPTVRGAASLPLLVEKRDDGTLLLEVDHEKGLRTGRYTFAFRHRTDLSGRGLLQRRAETAELRWSSPRFEQGVDSMRVVFRLPPSRTAPALPALETASGEGTFGAFIGQLRRAPDKDELEIVRPHVAIGEAVVWRAVVGAELAPEPNADAPVPAAIERPRPRPAQQNDALHRARAWGVLAAIALVYGLLVFAKWRGFSRACERRGARARALLPLPLGLRAPLAGLAVASAVGVALVLDAPTPAAALLAAGLALAALRGAVQPTRLRGPGRWLPLKEDEAFSAERERVPGVVLDATRWPGLLLLGSGIGASVAGAAWLLPRSPYDALLSLVASSVLLPLFCTGRSVDLPADPVRGPRRLFSKLSRALARRPKTKIVPWARVSDATGEVDELRLLVQLKPTPAGLLALELGVEPLRGAGGTVLSPFLLVRAQEGSAVQRALPRSVAFTRGRTPDERVAILRPALPTAGLTLALAERVCRLIESARDAQPEGPSKSRRSSGSSERTAKLGSVPSPAHAM